MDTPIKILHVVGRMDRGGTEALLMNLLRTIDRTKFQYDFVEQTQDICDYDQEIQSLGSTIYRAPHISPNNLGRYRAWWRSFFREHPEYRIVHGHSRGSGPIYLDEARKAGRITIAHCHSGSHGKGIAGLIRYIWQLPLRCAAKYNFACSYDAGISQYGKNGKFQVVKNGIQSDRFTWNPIVRNTVRCEESLGDAFVVGNVSRFELPKNHQFLISVFAEIKKVHPNAKLLLVGKGSLEEEIHRKIATLNLTADVIFTGARSDVNRLLQSMDAFVFPSHYEGLPLALVEAQAAGLPCFASAKVIAPEVKLTELIHFIPLEESAAHWAEYILANTIPLDQRRDQSRAIIDAGFDIRTTAEQLSNFYLEVLKDE